MKKAIVLFLMIIAVAFFALFVFQYCVFIETEKSVAKELNNHYIDSKYEGWKTVQLPNNSKIKIPVDWDITVDEDAISIVEKEKTVAKGIIINPKDDLTESDSSTVLSDFYKMCFGFPIELESSTELTVTNLGTGASYYLVVCSDLSGIEEYHYQLVLSYHYLGRIIFDFGDNKENDSESVLEQIEAIAFSYEQ